MFMKREKFCRYPFLILDFERIKEDMPFFVYVHKMNTRFTSKNV